MRNLIFVILFVAVCELAGCHTLTDAQRETIAKNAAAGRADVHAWATMTPAQQADAFRGSTAGWVALDYSQNGHEPGPEWRGIVGAPAPKATADAETPR